MGDQMDDGVSGGDDGDYEEAGLHGVPGEVDTGEAHGVGGRKDDIQVAGGGMSTERATQLGCVASEEA